MYQKSPLRTVRKSPYLLTHFCLSFSARDNGTPQAYNGSEEPYPCPPCLKGMSLVRGTVGMKVTRGAISSRKLKPYRHRVPLPPKETWLWCIIKTLNPSTCKISSEISIRLLPNPYPIYSKVIPSPLEFHPLGTLPPRVFRSCRKGKGERGEGGGGRLKDRQI